MKLNKVFSRHSISRCIPLTAMAGALMLLIFSGPVWAYDDYDGCESCHGSFDEGSYTSNVDGTNWGTDLMSGHEAFVGGTCNACHQSGDFGEVLLNFSSDATLSKGCVGCHGRDEDVTGTCNGLDGMQVQCGSGAGLRQHHETEVGTGTCKGCHSGDDTPVGEDILPFNYGKGGVTMKDSCDSDGTESQFGATGLDNDGDGQADAADSDCQQSENTPPTQPGALSASAVTASSATVQWGASSDNDGDSISYQVDYRRNGDAAWSDGGSTGNTSKALSGLNSGQSYDVRVTPNDGTENGPIRVASNLFQTLSGGSFTLQSCLNGNWFNAARNYEGLQLEFSDGGDGTLVLVVTMYSYDTTGNPIFLLGVRTGIVNTDSAQLNVFIYEGGEWGDDYDPNMVSETKWGTLTISATGPDTMSVTLTPNATYQALGYTELSYDLVRVTTPLEPCQG